MKVLAFACLFLATVQAHAATQQIAIWSFDTSLEVNANGSTPLAPTAEILTGSPTATVRNSTVYAAGTAGTAYTDFTGTSRTAGKAIGWPDFKKSGQPVDGQLDLALNATGYSALNLRFNYRHNHNDDNSENKLQLVFSTNGGSSFSSPVLFTVTDDDTWHSKTFALPTSLNGQSNVVIRIEGDPSTTNANEANNILIFDNIELTATDGGGGGGSGSPVLTVTSSSLIVPTGNPLVISGAISDNADPAKNTIVISPADSDTTDANLTAMVSSSTPSVATATLTRTTVGAQDNYALTITALAVGYTNITVTVRDPENHTATRTVQYAVSAASNTPANTRYHASAADASTAIALDENYMLVANDEDQILRLYDRNQSGLPLKTFDLNTNLNLAKEADFEASFRIGNRIYLLGSHGNDTEGKAEPTRDMVCSYDVSGTGAATTLTFVGQFKNLQSQLITWDNANGEALGLADSSPVGILPTDAEGFNIEAATQFGTNVYVGFRAPLQNKSARNKALIIPVSNFTTVVNNSSGTMSFGTPILLDLGGRSIRSLSTTPNGEILILAGPVDSGTHTFEFYRWNGSPASAPVLVPSSVNAAAANTGFTGKPEAIVDPPPNLSGGSQVQVLQDNGDTIYYNDGQTGKAHSTRAFAKSRSELLTLGTPPVVTTLVDENNVNPGNGLSLREALASVFTGDTITFAPALSGGTITLTNGQLTVDTDVTIDASSLSSGITVVGNGSSRVLEIASGKTASLKSLSISHGRASGASAPANSGGGIYNHGGTLTLSLVTFDDNQATGQGGALYNAAGTATVSNCTFTNNSATSHGGGISHDGGTLALAHVTVAANTSSSQGGGLARISGTATVNNSIVAGNTAPASANISGTFTGSGNLTTGAPLLAPLASYGGPAKTMPPLPGSPAIEAAGSSALGTDQRLDARPKGPLPDAGAVEAVPFSSLTLVDTDHDEIDDRVEPAYSLVVGENNQNRDSDGDGTTDADEILTMTNPLNSQEKLQITTFTPNGFEQGTDYPIFNLTFKTFPGLEYELEASQTLDGFAPVPGTRFTADGFSKTMTVTLLPGRDFVRVSRR